MTARELTDVEKKVLGALQPMMEQHFYPIAKELLRSESIHIPVSALLLILENPEKMKEFVRPVPQNLREFVILRSEDMCPAGSESPRPRKLPRRLPRKPPRRPPRTNPSARGGTGMPLPKVPGWPGSSNSSRTTTG